MQQESNPNPLNFCENRKFSNFAKPGVCKRRVSFLGCSASAPELIDVLQAAFLLITGHTLLTQMKQNRNKIYIDNRQLR